MDKSVKAGLVTATPAGRPIAARGGEFDEWMGLLGRVATMLDSEIDSRSSDMTVGDIRAHIVEYEELRDAVLRAIEELRTHE